MQNIRFLAQITLQAKTPLKVGSGDSDFLSDAPVQKDFNGLPMILGTSIAGVLRDKFRSVLKEKENEIFGYEEHKKDKGQSSNLIVSNAMLCDENNKVVEELGFNSKFLDEYLNLPLRDHAAIDEKGVAKEHSKFDEEVVFKGSRFKFELELLSDRLSHNEWNNIIYAILSEDFRLGGGSTKGFGSFECIKINSRVLNLDDKSDLNEYLNKTSSLNSNFKWQEFKKDDDNLYKNSYTKYTLKLKPDDFFIFGSGFGDNEADNTPVYEKVVVWENNRGSFSQEKVLIPASSIKGAIAHRVAYHYNLLNSATIENGNGKVGEENKAVVEIFGHKKENKDNKELGKKGKILIGDCFINNQPTKVFDHVSIDRFTGGAIDGALFQEKTVASDDSFVVEILLDKSVDGKELEAFENTLKDISSGMLGLGGMNAKGHGFFSGEVFKDGEKL
jgi:CRISPR/Cas system CSM-associated protein Csm3 (group 7 of RAMP superfamily)